VRAAGGEGFDVFALGVQSILWGRHGYADVLPGLLLVAATWPLRSA